MTTWRVRRLKFADGARRSERGSTYIEILVAIVLMGTAVVATLVAARVATTASTVDRDHAEAYGWLQAASDAVFNKDRVPCVITSLNPADADLPSDWVDNKANVRAAYETAVNSVTPPPGWSNISIPLIEYLGRSSPSATSFEWGAYCFEGVRPDANGDGNPEDYRESPFYSQKITIQVVSPNGRIVKTIHTVKGE